MGLRIEQRLTAKSLLPGIHRLLELSAAKILSLQRSWDPRQGTPVFSVQPLHEPRLDGVDPGIPIRLRLAAV
jgi:hypothetical protein